MLEGPGPDGRVPGSQGLEGLRDNLDREEQVPDSQVLEGLRDGRPRSVVEHRSPVVPAGRIRSGPAARSRLIPLGDVASRLSPHP